MKKAFLFTLAVLTVMSMLIAMPATPAAAKSNERSLTLYLVQYIPGKGVVFKFHVQGDFKDFPGSVVVNGQKYALNCALNDDSDLTCTADQGLGRFVGQTATVTVNGYTSSAKIRTATQANTGYCYSAYTWIYTGEAVPGSVWSDSYPMGAVCQDAPAVEGDEIIIKNGYAMYPDGPYYFDEGGFIYSLESPYSAFPTDFGPGYYIYYYGSK